MDANTRFLIQRMDEMETRIMNKLDPVLVFHSKILAVVGLFGVVTGGIGSLVINILVKHF